MIKVVQILQSAEAAAALLNAPRIAILQNLAEPNSASGLARRVGLPRQQINYHIHEMEKAGLIEFIEERRKGNCIERVVRASARSYVISPEILGKLGETLEDQSDRFSLNYLIGLAVRAIRELASLRQRALAANKRISTLALETEIRFASAERRAAFGEELTHAIAHLTAKYHSPSGRTFRVIAGAYPAVSPAPSPAPAKEPS